jgi:Kef-type K+ transport system membrane component KefB
VIGFLVGGELEFAELKKYARKFSMILLVEGMLATLFVTAFSFLVAWWALDNTTYALVIAIMLGAIASATDPASTMGVIWEYKAAGVLTTTLIAIVALDDVLAMALYGIASNVAQNLSGHSHSLSESVLHFARDIGGAIVIGSLVGYGLVVFIKKRGNSENNLFAVLGCILLSVGLADVLKSDLILAAMSAGIVARNLASQFFEKILEQIRHLANPIYILFFVLVGARMSFSGMPGWLWAVVAVYVIGRNGGKVLGAWAGAKLSKADPVVAQNTGFGLFSQGGVAIGLAIVASNHLQHVPLTPEMNLGQAIVTIVTTTTFFIQLTGPAAVKWALTRAGETQKRLNTSDFLESQEAAGALSDFPTCKRDTPATHLISIFSEISELESVAVLDEKEQFLGEITLKDLKPVLSQKELWPILVADDILHPERETLQPQSTLKHSMQMMENLGCEQLCVINKGIFQGYLHKHNIRQKIKNFKLQTA